MGTCVRRGWGSKPRDSVCVRERGGCGEAELEIVSVCVREKERRGRGEADRVYERGGRRAETV